MTLYDSLNLQTMDLSRLGLTVGASESDYFCTPVGAQVLWWTGVDGIHYCTIRGFDDMIFVVDPSSVPGDYVHPVAASVKDFLMLLLACSSEAAIAQAYRWERTVFDVFVEENQPDTAAKEVLTALQMKTNLDAMDDPYGYIRELQASFDYRKLKFKPDYYEWAPEEPLVPTAPPWNVFFEGGFFEKSSKSRPGQELRVDKTIPWGDELWHIPSVYVCGKGLVVDLCIEVEPARFRAFAEKWKLYEDDTMAQYSDAERAEAEAENPLQIEFHAEVAVNGKRMRQTHGYGSTWLAELPAGFANDRKAQWHLEHYGLDKTKCWALRRLSFPWATKCKPSVKTLSLTLIPDPVSLSAGQFATPQAGETIPLTNPHTGAVYALTVESLTEASIDKSHFHDPGMDYPTQFLRMDYRISPELPDLSFSIRDCSEGDRPRRRADAPGYLPEAVNSVAIAVIGGADGPTAVFAGSTPGKLRAACSGLYFDVPQTITWRAAFYETLREPLMISLL